MRITHSQGEHVVVLSDEEASLVVDACALLVIASQSVPSATLPADMAKVLGQLFAGLKPPAPVGSGFDQDV